MPLRQVTELLGQGEAVADIYYQIKDALDLQLVFNAWLLDHGSLLWHTHFEVGFQQIHFRCQAAERHHAA